ncbi:hypothetical protein BDF14DRAFT_1724110, partial [Spinellus fusiger]
GINNTLILNKISKTITPSTTGFKETISTRVTYIVVIIFEFPEPVLDYALDFFIPVLTSYPVAYQFSQENIYYNPKTNVISHMTTFYYIVHLFIFDLELHLPNYLFLRLS